MNSRLAPAERAAIGNTAQVLKTCRELAGLSQRELAALAGIHYTTISDYETDKSVPQEKTVARVLAALGLTAADREMAESFVRKVAHNLRPTPLERGAVPQAALPSSSGEIAVWRKQMEQTVYEGSRLLTRFVLLLCNLLTLLAEAATGEAGPGKPDV